MTWLAAFAITLAVEVPLAVVGLRAWPRRRVIAAATVANAVSHPLLCFVLLRVLPGPFAARVLAGELAVIVLEALVYRAILRLRSGHALAVAATLNAASYLIGIAFFNAAL